MLKPPLPWKGGKSQLRKQIIEMFPDHVCYTEPFFGMGWVYFGKAPSKVEVINDVNGEVINLFRMIKYHSDEIQRLMEYEVSARDQFDYYQAINIKQLTEIQRAIRFMFIISQSFGGMGKTFGYGTQGRPKPQIFDTDQLKHIKARLRNTYIENKPFLDIIQRYDRSHTLHFCDPPYFATSGYEHDFTDQDHILLRDILKNVKGNFLLTIDDHPEVRALYKGFNILETEVRYSVSRENKGRRNFKELIISNF